MDEDNTLETYISTWRAKHGPISHRSRGTKLREVVTVAFADGSAGRLSREAGARGWTVEQDPDRKVEVDWSSLPAHVRQAAEPVQRVARPARPTNTN